MPRSEPGPVTVLASILTLPEEGAINPAIVLSNVVLPQPDGPSTTVKLPSGSARSIPERTVWAPRGVSKVTLSESTRIMALLRAGLFYIRRRDGRAVVGQDGVDALLFLQKCGCIGQRLGRATAEQRGRSLVREQGEARALQQRGHIGGGRAT